MKTLPAVAAVSIALALLLVPLASTAAGSISFTSPAAGASFSGSQAYTISGTVSPAPTQADGVGITVKNPAGQVVDQDTAAVTSGAFSYSTAVGGTSSWTTGTYTISATDSFGATGSATFTYTSTIGTSYNQTKALVDIMGNLTIIQQEIKNLNNDLHGNVTAIQATQTTQSTAITGLTSSLASITQTLSGVTSTLTGVQSSLTSLTASVSGLVTTVGNINTAVSGMSSQVTTAANNALNASNAVSSTQTYVLVVAVLAAITLVLELAILVRKVS
jgi:hypothetical protein